MEATSAGWKACRFLNIASSGNVTLQNLTIQNGYAGLGKDGGNIFNQGTLTLKNTLVAMAVDLRLVGMVEAFTMTPAPASTCKTAACLAMIAIPAAAASTTWAC